MGGWYWPGGGWSWPSGGVGWGAPNGCGGSSLTGPLLFLSAKATNLDARFLTSTWFRPSLDAVPDGVVAEPQANRPVRRVLSSSIDFDLVPLRWAGAAMLALGLVLPHLPGNPGVPCPLRTLTGVPCPLCGMTTSVKAVMGGHLGAALSANPFGVVAVIAAAVLVLRPRAGRLRVSSVLLIAGVVASWGLELHRFHFV